MHLERSGIEAKKIQKLVCVVSHWLEGNFWTQRVRKKNYAFLFREEISSRVVKNLY